MKYYFLFLISFVIIFNSCSDRISKGQRIKASGTLIDTVKNKPLPQYKVYLVSAKKYNGSHSSGWDYLLAVDSTTTDKSGKFSFDYIAEGNSDDYAISIERTIRQANTGITNDGFPIYKFNGESELRDVRVYAREMDSLELHLQVDDNPYDTLIVDVYNYTDVNPKFILVGRTIDTILRMKCIVSPGSNIVSYYLSDYVYKKLAEKRMEPYNKADLVVSALNAKNFVNRCFESTDELVQKPPHEFSIAGADLSNNKVDLAVLLKDPKLIPNKQGLKIISYKLSVKIGATDESEAVKFAGDELKDDMLGRLKNLKAGDVANIYFSDVMIEEKPGEISRLSDLYVEVRN